MKRRKFIAVLASAGAWPLAARGQSTQKVRRLAWLGEVNVGRRKAFFAALQELGYIEGQNLAVVYRFADAKFERLPALAGELVDLKVEVIVAESTQALIALKQATSTIPIVMVLPGDPVGAGLIKSLSHPGGNITGTSLMMPDIGGKRLQLLTEMVPTMRRVAIFGNPKNASTAEDMRATEAAARMVGLQVYMMGLESSERLENSLNEMLNAKPDGVIVVLDSLVMNHREKIAEVALRNRLPLIGPGRQYVESGGLAGFGPNLDAVSRRAAIYVDKILKGAKPADLPVEQPTQFELFINLKTAKALGLELSASLLARADEVIE